MGRPISARPELRYLPIKFKNRGHGHVAVYSVDQHAVSILHVFHTAQDWQNRLAAEKPGD
jgi:plasmid stabilization system protein ParE